MQHSHRTEEELRRLENLLVHLEEVHHKNLLNALHEVERDLVIAEKPLDKHSVRIEELSNKFAEIKNEIPVLVKTETRMIFPHIRAVIAGIDSATAQRDYNNLASPVRSLIIHHHQLLDKIKSLLQLVTALGYSGFSGKEYVESYIALYNFYSFYEKQIYLEENILFPSLVHAFEMRD